MHLARQYDDTRLCHRHLYGPMIDTAVMLESFSAEDLEIFIWDSLVVFSMRCMLETLYSMGRLFTEFRHSSMSISISSSGRPSCAPSAVFGSHAISVFRCGS
jgi:hypothetical protein